MDSYLITYPAFALIFLTLFLYVKNRIDAKIAYEAKDIDPLYFKTYSGEAPHYLETSRQTLKNQFELPIIFYLLVSLLASTKLAGWSDVIFAWLFVISRYVHCYIRLSSNYIPHRSKIFTAGVLLLIGGWISFLIKLGIGSLVKLKVGFIKKN